MIFDGHSDIFTDVTVRRLKGETQVLKNHHLPRLRKGNIEGGLTLPMMQILQRDWES